MNRQKFQLLSEILEYPGPRLIEQAKTGMKLLAETNQEAADRLRRFVSLTEGLPAGRLEEVYSGTFDLQVVCYPYVGYHLFGESYKRGAFMVALKERYREYGIPEGNELPDHLSLMLRYFSVLDDEAEADELARDCLIPALEKMEQGFKDKDNPYREIVGVVLLLLKEMYPGGPSATSHPPADFLAHGRPAGGAGKPRLSTGDRGQGRPRLPQSDSRPFPGPEADAASEAAGAGCGSCFPQIGNEER